MNYNPFSSSFFIKKRKQIADQINSKALVILFSNDLMPKSGDQFYPFRQDSNILYLSGLDQEDCTICIEINNEGQIISETAFIPETNALKMIWDGPRFTKKQASDVSGIKDIRWNDSEESFLVERINAFNTVYINTDDFFKFISPIKRKSVRNFESFQKEFPEKEFLRLQSVVNQLRPVKEKEEIQRMKKAAEITGDAFHVILKNLKPGMKEYQIESLIGAEFVRQGGSGHAYLPIVAGGKNACVLHYIKNEDELKNGELLLMDFGVEYGNYAADCSRTIPVNGKFSERQLACYNAVYDIFRKAKQLFTPGNTINNINEQVNRWMEEKMIELGLFTEAEKKEQDPKNPLFKKYFMHGTSHFLGLDVHDVGEKDRPFKKGMILTCEPGIYITEENIGIRIENDILVDNTPVDLMAHIPVTAKEIEDLMAGSYTPEADSR